MQTQNKAITILRWGIFLPGAVLAAWFAWILVIFLGRLGWARFAIPPESFISQFYLNTLGHAAMGVAFILAGAKIAPAKQTNVAYILSGLGLVICGFLFFPAIIMGSGWAIWGTICTIGGIGVTTYSIYKGEIDI